MNIAVITALGGVLMAATGLAATNAPQSRRPSEGFRQEHVQIREHLSQISALAGNLPAQPPADQRNTMKEISDFLKNHIKPHAEWEEKVLYPAVDKRSGCQTNRFTATMRNDHKIVGRWISALEAASKRDKTDIADFARKTDQLLGLITAHFENEEEVLLPILDKSMTPEEFDREIMKKKA